MPKIQGLSKVLKFFFLVNLLLGLLLLIGINSSFNFPYFSVSAMKVLIIESEYELGLVWKRALERFGVKVVLVADQRVLSQILGVIGLIVVVGHTYSARAANCLNGQ